MPETRIRTLLFDIGGVLLTNGWDHQERDVVLRRFGVEKGPFEARHPEANDLWEKGLLTVEQYLDRTVFFEPRAFSHSDFFEAMKEQSKLIADSAFGILERLAASQKLQFGVVNNEARELNGYRIEKFGLRNYFQCFVSSCYVGLRKPDHAIYRLALDVLQRDPREVVFIDDRAENAGAAASVGMRAIQYQGSAKLRAQLQQLGIEL